MSTAVPLQRRPVCRIARTIAASVSLVRIQGFALAPSADLVKGALNEAPPLGGKRVWVEEAGFLAEEEGAGALVGDAVPVAEAACAEEAVDMAEADGIDDATAELMVHVPAIQFRN